MTEQRFSRRSFLRTGAVTLSATATTLVSGCTSNEPNSNSENDENSGSVEKNNGAISQINVVNRSQLGPGLEITIKEGEASSIALQKDGTNIQDEYLSPGETKKILDLTGVTTSEYKVIAANSDGEIVGEKTWSPNFELDVTEANITGERSASENPDLRFNTNIYDLVIKTEYKTDIPISIQDVYVSKGFPTNTDDTDQPGDLQSWGGLPISENTKNVYVSYEGSDFWSGLLTPQNDECTGETKSIELTLEFSNAKTRVINMDVNHKGDIDNNCQNSTVNITDTKIVGGTA